MLEDLIPYAFGGSVLLAGFIGWGGHALCNAVERARDLRDEAEAEQRKQTYLDMRRRQLNRQVAETQAEIARRRKLKKKGLPVTPLRQRLNALTTERLRIAA